jgi:hypothetical protein
LPLTVISFPQEQRTRHMALCLISNVRLGYSRLTTVNLPKTLPVSSLASVIPTTLMARKPGQGLCSRQLG